MTMTTLLVDNGRILDWDLHEARLRQGCEELALPWPRLELPSISGRARLRIIITEAGVEYSIESYPPYEGKPLSLTVKEDRGIRLKTIDSLERKAWGEVVTINHERLVLQAGCANLFWVEEGMFGTPCLKTLQIVEGTALKRLLKIYPFHFYRWTIDELQRRRPYLFLCNALREIVPVERVGEGSFPLDASLHNEILCQYREDRLS